MPVARGIEGCVTAVPIRHPVTVVIDIDCRRTDIKEIVFRGALSGGVVHQNVIAKIGCRRSEIHANIRRTGRLRGEKDRIVIDTNVVALGVNSGDVTGGGFSGSGMRKA